MGSRRKDYSSFTWIIEFILSSQLLYISRKKLNYDDWSRIRSRSHSFYGEVKYCKETLSSRQDSVIDASVFFFYPVGRTAGCARALFIGFLHFL